MPQTAQYQRPEGVRQAEMRATLDALRSADKREIMRIKRGSLDYQCAVNAALIELDGMPRGPMLSPDEMDALEKAFDYDVPVAEFVQRVRMVRGIVR